MLRARFYTAGDGVHMKLRGHAGSGPAGQDLVCAAASALACTLAGALERMDGQGMLAKPARISLRSGAADIAAVPRPECRSEVLMAFWMTEVGFHLLDGKYVRLEEVMTVETAQRT